MSDWFVYAASGKHLGPFSSEALVREIRFGNVPEDALVTENVWFGTPGELPWKPASDIPELQRLLSEAKGLALRLVEGAFTATARGTPEFGATVMMIGGGGDKKSG